MCGIVGSFHPEGRTAEAAVIVQMRDRMAHRGPDGAGLWCSPDRRCRFAHRRLAIIDLAPEADQPMTNRDGSVSVIFNGEIYNHADIRAELEAAGRHTWRTDHADSEVIVHAHLLGHRPGVEPVKPFQPQ